MSEEYKQKPNIMEQFESDQELHQRLIKTCDWLGELIKKQGGTMSLDRGIGTEAAFLMFEFKGHAYNVAITDKTTQDILYGMYLAEEAKRDKKSNS